MALQSGRQCSSESGPSVTGPPGCSMVCVLLETLSLEDEISRADGSVSPLHLPGSTHLIFPFYNVVPSRSRWVGTQRPHVDRSRRTQQQSPGETPTLGRSEGQISVKHLPHASASFSFSWKLVQFPLNTLLSRQMDGQRDRYRLFWRKHVSDYVQLSARLHDLLLKNHSHLICRLHPSLLNTSYNVPEVLTFLWNS